MAARCGAGRRVGGQVGPWIAPQPAGSGSWRPRRRRGLHVGDRTDAPDWATRTRSELTRRGSHSVNVRARVIALEALGETGGSSGRARRGPTTPVKDRAGPAPGARRVWQGRSRRHSRLDQPLSGPARDGRCLGGGAAQKSDERVAVRIGEVQDVPIQRPGRSFRTITTSPIFLERTDGRRHSATTAVVGHAHSTVGDFDWQTPSEDSRPDWQGRRRGRPRARSTNRLFGNSRAGTAGRRKARKKVGVELRRVGPRAPGRRRHRAWARWRASSGARAQARSRKNSVRLVERDRAIAKHDLV